MGTVVQSRLAAATKATMALLEDRTARCGECQLSTYNLRNVLVKRLGISVNTSKLLVPLVIEILIDRGLLEFWDRKTKGIVYSVNASRLREVEMTIVPEMTANL